MLTVFWTRGVHWKFLSKEWTGHCNFTEAKTKSTAHMACKPARSRLAWQCRPHTSIRTRTSISLQIEVIPHPPYSPNLSPSDFYLFRHLKKGLKGIRFISDDKLQKRCFVLGFVHNHKNLRKCCQKIRITLAKVYCSQWRLC